MRSDSLRPCACGRHYDTERWAALHLFARLSAADVSSFVTPWPPDVVVEIRVCAHCNRKMSRPQHARRRRGRDRTASHRSMTTC
jgi:hypothetical protein